MKTIKDANQLRNDEIEKLQVRINELVCDKDEVRGRYIKEMTVLENKIDELATERNRLQRLQNQN